MSILGKLLIVFNLLAAGAFTYMTLGNWKVRQELTRAAIEREVKLRGLPVEGPATPPADLSPDRVAFTFEMPGGLHYTSIEKNLLKSLVPAGDTRFGGEPVANQTEEVKRVQKKVADSLADDKLTPAERTQWLRAYLASVARSGLERDGVNALFDMLDDTRKDDARRDLPLLARTPGQMAALQALVAIDDLKDPQAITPDTARDSRVSQAREAVKRFLLGEVARGVPPIKDPKSETDRNAHDEAARVLRNAVNDALRDNAGEAQKSAVVAAATADAAGWGHLAGVAVEPLRDRPSIDRAIAGLLAYAQEHAATETEKTALAGLKELISPPPVNFDKPKTVEEVGTNLLNSKFDHAALPAAAGKQAAGPSTGHKARQIAHLLYHIDGWRHAVQDDTTVADRKAWHQRVASVVGLPEYIRTAEAQASEYAEAGQRLLSAITEEQSGFEAEYQAQVQRVQALYAEWFILDAQYKAQETVTKENERLMQERLTERDNLRVELEKATEDAKVALDRLRATQVKLFNIQRDLRNAHTAILAMEKELRRIELGPVAEKK